MHPASTLANFPPKRTLSILCRRESTACSLTPQNSIYGSGANALQSGQNALALPPLGVFASYLYSNDRPSSSETPIRGLSAAAIETQMSSGAERKDVGLIPDAMAETRASHISDSEVFVAMHPVVDNDIQQESSASELASQQAATEPVNPAALDSGDQPLELWHEVVAKPVPHPGGQG